MGGERQGTVALPSQAGFDGTPGDRFGPEKSGSQRPVWKRVKARILLAGGVGDNVTQSVSSQGVVGVNGQSGGTQRDQERERRWRPVKALSQESDRKQRRSRIQTSLEAGAVLFSVTRIPWKRIDDVPCTTGCGQSKSKAAAAAAVSRNAPVLFYRLP